MLVAECCETSKSSCERGGRSCHRGLEGFGEARVEGEGRQGWRHVPNGNGHGWAERRGADGFLGGWAVTPGATACADCISLLWDLQCICCSNACLSVSLREREMLINKRSNTGPHQLVALEVLRAYVEERKWIEATSQTSWNRLYDTHNLTA